MFLIGLLQESGYECGMMIIMIMIVIIGIIMMMKINFLSDWCILEDEKKETEKLWKQTGLFVFGDRTQKCFNSKRTKNKDWP